MGSLVLGESNLVDRYPYDTNEPVWPVTVPELKEHIQISHSEDDLLLSLGTGGYLADATEYVETRGQVSLIFQKRQMICDELPGGESIHILRGPLVSVTSVRYLSNKEWVTLDPSKWRPIPKQKRACIYFDESVCGLRLDSGPGTVVIDMVCGFGDNPDKVPAQWRQIIAAVTAHSYERRTLIAGGGLDEAMERVWDRKITIAGAVRRGV